MSNRIKSLLTPEVRHALLGFARTHGKIQVNENVLVWVHHGLSTEKVPAVIAGLKQLAHVLVSA